MSTQGSDPRRPGGPRPEPRSAPRRPSPHEPVSEGGAGDAPAHDEAVHTTGSMRAVGSGLGTGAKATARGLKATAKVTGKASRATFVRARQAAGAQGAERSGLNRLIELHACNTAGDAAFAIALAGTIFFAGATSEQRGPVILFLGLTMLPFAVVAPLLGPFLDRFSHGRRWAIGATFAVRAFLCWVLAGAIADDSWLFYPAALGVLISSKAYGVAKASAVPRLLPAEITLVKANGRVSLAGVVGASVSAPLAGAAAYFGAEWALRYAFVVFIVGTIAAILLPSKVDSTEGEDSIEVRRDPVTGARKGSGVPPQVAFALRANCGPRLLSGFLTMYMAFVLRTDPLDGWEDKTTLLLGLVIGAAGLGNTLGIVISSLAKKINPSVMVVVALLADVAILVVATVVYTLPTLVALGLTAGLMQNLAKVSLDTTIQTTVPVRSHASAFARGDTTLQLAWVIGGFIGVTMSWFPSIGLLIAAFLVGGWAVVTLRNTPGRIAKNRVSEAGTADVPVTTAAPPPPTQ